jgi:GAF domain-containing protein
MSADDLQRSLEQLSRTLVTDHDDLASALSSVAALGCGLVEGCRSASITAMKDGKPATVAFTDDTAIALDEAQYDARTGPCLEAIARGETLIVESIAEDRRWAEFNAEALANGVRSSMALPLTVDSETVGVLNLYGEHPGVFGRGEDRIVLEPFTDLAAGVIANAVAYWTAIDLTHDLNTALETRGAIERAKGILMATEGMTSDEAFGVLRRASQRENRKLRDIAAEIDERPRERRPE